MTNESDKVASEASAGSLVDTISLALSKLAKTLDYDIEQDEWEVTFFRGSPHVSMTFSRDEIEHISIETLYRLLQAGRHLKTLRPEDLEGPLQ